MSPYGELKPKDLLGIPWMVAFALRADGWYLRSDIIWHKTAPMPESVRDRPTSAHEHMFLLAKRPTYYYDADAIREEAEERVLSSWTERREHEPVRRGDPGESGHVTSTATLASRAGRNKRNVWTVNPQPFSWGRTSRRVRVEPGAAGDGIERTTSPDCPVHGDHFAPVPTASDGGRAGPRPSRSPGSDAGRAQEQPDDSAPIGQRHGQDSADGSSDSPAPSTAAATPRSTRIRKTDPVPATSQPCTPSAGTVACTGDTSASPEMPAELRPDTDASRTSLDGSADHRSSETAAGTAGKSAEQGASACTCEHYRLEPIDHFAVFPPKLIEPCVLAGSSPRACGVCGAPWERVVERTRMVQGSVGGSAAAASSALHGCRDQNYNGHGETKVHTVGWKPFCTCTPDDIPEGVDEAEWNAKMAQRVGSCVVLDPFAGAGTTGLVALQHGRSFLGIELNPAYAEMASERIATAERLGFRPPVVGPDPIPGQLSMDGETVA